MSENQSTLVVGGAGYLGCVLIEKLLNRSHRGIKQTIDITGSLFEAPQARSAVEMPAGKRVALA
jgi:nucleoside-diphosphate-sugar epimerase